MKLYLVVGLILISSQIQIVLSNEAFSTEEDRKSVESHYDSMLNLYNRFRDLDQETADISEENPGKEFISKYVKPLRLKLKELSNTIKSLQGIFVESSMIELKSAQDNIVTEIAELEINFAQIQSEGETKREDVVKKIDSLLNEMKELEEIQKEHKYEDILDIMYSNTFDPLNHHSLATQIEIIVLKMSMGIIKDLPASLKQLKEEKGEPVNENEIKSLTQAQLTQEIAERLIQKKNEDLTPSTFLPKMIKTLEDISEYFQAKISENYEFMSEEYAEESKKITKYWISLQKKIEDLGKYLDLAREDSINKDEL